jgi:hypothetical protein
MVDAQIPSAEGVPSIVRALGLCDGIEVYQTLVAFSAPLYLFGTQGLRARNAICDGPE